MKTLLERMEPSSSALLDWLRPEISPSLLEVIAQADYGMDEEAHLVALQSIHCTGIVPPRLEWVPGEVLELIRWSVPEDPSWKPGLEGLDGHRIRAFSCAILLIAAARPENCDGGENQTLVSLIDSTRVLGSEARRHTRSLVAWRIRETELEADDRPFFTFAILLLTVFLGGGEDPERELTALADEVVAEEANARKSRGCRDDLPDDWLLGITFFDLRHALWRKLAAEAANQIPSEKARMKFEEILRRLG